MSQQPEQAHQPSRTPPPWRPTTGAEREAVREELGRILSSALLRNSKRFPAFLRYTVEHALTSSEPLKERTIGYEVFARDPGYDTSADPVVRMTAAEVRKRLAQYYQLPDHRGELVITYQPGTYVPDFFHPPTTVVTESPSAPPARRARAGWLFTAAAVCVTAVLAAWLLAGRTAAHSSDTLGRFWAPILASSDSLLLCIGDPTRFPDQADPARDS